jgi:hypothetical protein
VKTAWIAAISSAHRDLSSSDWAALKMIGYSAVALRYFDDASDASVWSESAKAIAHASMLPVWLWLPESALRSESHLEKSLPSLGACDNGVATLLIESKDSAKDLSLQLKPIRAYAAKIALGLRIVVTRTPFQTSPDQECERVDWLDIEDEDHSRIKDSSYSASLLRITDSLELMQQTPADSHRSIVIPSTYLEPRPNKDGSTQRGLDWLNFSDEIVSYWVREIEKIARNNPDPAGRLVFVRGNPLGLARALSEAGSSSPQPDSYHAIELRAPNAATTPQPTPRVAIVLHLFYLELWNEFAEALSAMPEMYDLYVTVPIGLAWSFSEAIRTLPVNVFILPVANCGRDVLPFFVVHSRYDLTRYEVICKLHSKRSLHVTRNKQTPLNVTDGEDWRSKLKDGLLGTPAQIVTILSEFRASPRVGMICPAGFIQPLAVGTAGSLYRWRELIAQMQLDAPNAAYFAAGTMFWARISAIRALLDLRLTDADFESERGQLDYTLHHALERMFGLTVAASGYQIVATPKAHTQDDPTTRLAQGE